MYYIKHRRVVGTPNSKPRPEAQGHLDIDQGAKHYGQYLKCPRAEAHYLAYQPALLRMVHIIYQVVVMVRLTIIDRT